MGALDNIRTIMRLSGDLANHGGDIAVLKMDMMGVNARPELRDQLAPADAGLISLRLDELRQMPPGSFGKAYADFLDANGLSTLVLSDAVDEPMRARNAFGIRYMATHDMFHVLLGYGPDWVGEMGVLAFTCGQNYNSTVWQQAVAAWLMYPFWSRFKIGALLAAWRDGKARGERAPFLLGMRLEDRFADPLEDLQAELGLV